MIKKYTINGRSGVWRTIGGRRVFIADGDSLSKAMRNSGKFKNGNRREVQEAQAEARVDKLGKKNTELYKKHGGFADTGDKAENRKVDRAHKQWLDNAREANDKKAIYQWGEYDNPKEAEKSYDLVGQHINKDQQLRSIKAKDDYDYNLYKKARIDENSIDPMTENSTDWEALDKRYRSRYDKERADELARYKQGMADYWERKAQNTSKDADFTRQHAQETADRLRADIPEWMEVGSKSVQDKDGFSTDYTLYLNTKDGKMATVFGDKEIYNVDTGTDMDFDTPEEAWNWFDNYKGFEDEEEDGLLGKMNKDSKMLKSRKDNWSNAEVPKVSTQGKSNRKEVSANIQKHIRDYYDSPEEFVSQMEAMKDPSHPTAWSWGQELAKGGNYLIYNSDMADFLSGLKINPKNKAFNDEQVFNNYTALIGRESAKMYDNIRKDAVKTLSERYSGTIDYLKETENMSTSEILELLKKMEK